MEWYRFRLPTNVIWLQKEADIYLHKKITIRTRPYAAITYDDYMSKMSADICHDLPLTRLQMYEKQLKKQCPVCWNEKRVVGRKAVTAFLLVFPVQSAASAAG